MEKYKFGEFIYQKRKSLSITQDELGRRLGVTNKAVSKWETGETMPEVTMLVSLAKELQITVDELLTQSETKVKEQKVKKVNKVLLIGLICLLIIELCTITFFVIREKNTQALLYKDIELSTLNYDDYININPVYNFDCINQELTLESSFVLNKDYKQKEDLNLSIEYTIHLYYYKTDGNTGIISYYNRNSSIIVTDEKMVFNQIICKPLTLVENFAGLKKIEVQYEITSCEGTIVKR